MKKTNLLILSIACVFSFFLSFNAHAEVDGKEHAEIYYESLKELQSSYAKEFSDLRNQLLDAYYGEALSMN